MKEPKSLINEGTAIASIIMAVLGILAALFLARHASIGIALSTTGLGFGVLGLKTTKKGMSWAGILAGILGLHINVLAVLSNLPR
ncbi:MAG: hypothetical protein OEY93_09970 [Anaerolineae bacterium]|nr:hypothetical protein [Anaerolineae bacterium]